MTRKTFAYVSYVALRKESVDRNPHRISMGIAAPVALRKESVDRNNLTRYDAAIKEDVALRKESVDRNYLIAKKYGLDNESLSARRAWIEISGVKLQSKTVSVALRKESVDRNGI